MSLFQLLVSADAVVPDHDATIRRCVDEWGLPEPHQRWTQAPAGYAAKWTFARVHPDRRLAPTAFEILGIPYKEPARQDRPIGYPFLPEIAASQGRRPSRNHSTVVAADVEAVAGRMRTTGAPFRLDPPNEVLSFRRLWVGFSSDHPDRYDPSADAGIRIEVIPFDVLRLPTGLPTAPSPAGGGSPVRIAARTLFVSDLGDALRVLDRNFGFAPAGPVIKSQDGLRRARMPFHHINSAEVELIEVGGSATGPEADFGAQWGPGPWSVRIEVDDLDALVKRFDGRGIPCHRLPPAEPGGPERVLRPAEWDLGTAFEFVELA